ncbi:sensor histidine kinase [Halarcobacter bivalviorum]|uniref:histidine kinase n=1 Tax=Halarcobacter bivalviorum TaxID=663364 RepID=A0AAX2ACQ4_9BACT|nr:HAMP domain-containing sensor histidine kinase [Halarcobacter bivalviorum]AXH11755.1 two-component system sensor histidine kinase [Halarcobacter bivalviorum]RXK10883.1 histidine kinase [Halarcobacter bivalviorum]
MFNKEGIPFFTVIIPFLSILFIAFFATSYHLKVTNEAFDNSIKEYKQQYILKSNDSQNLEKQIHKKTLEHKKYQKEFTDFMVVLTIAIIIFMALFSLLMISIISDVVKKYKEEVENKEHKLQTLNKSLASKVAIGIEEGKRKDKAILQQSKLARMGSMINMIAHQWRQPLTELSGVLMELETATRFKKVTDNHILNSIERSDKMIEFMSNTIDDFRNFFKPDKKKEKFSVLDSCQKAINLINASLDDAKIKLIVDVKNDKQINGYPTEFSQVILNLLMNAKDILVEKEISTPKIVIIIETKGLLSIVRVKDNAGGIKPEHFDLIFDPYFSTKDSSKGTGLGLYISKLIIERNMGGEFSVSNDDEGAVFKIILAG